MCFVSGHALFPFKIKLTSAVLLLCLQNFLLKNADVRVKTSLLALRVEVLRSKKLCASFVCEICSPSATIPDAGGYGKVPVGHRALGAALTKRSLLCLLNKHNFQRLHLLFSF